MSGRDPSRASWYVGDGFYHDLVRRFSGWRRDDREIADPAVRDRCRRLLEREARLLEEDRHEDWLALYAGECLYWVPASPGGGDPRTEVAVAFDDRRRLEDRIFRLRTGHAWSQQPPSRTSRVVSNVTVYGTAEPGVLMARSTFLTTELRGDDRRQWAGWFAHRFEAPEDGPARIAVKQVNLIDCDRNLRNPSITL